jgi:carboxyl-terminal processing protease
MHKLKILTFLFVFLLCQAQHIFSQEANPDDKKGYLIKNQISDADKLKVFNNLWESVNQMYFDSTFNGVNWAKMHEIYQPQVLSSKGKIELINTLNKMLAELKSSHLAVITKVSISRKKLSSMFGKNVDYKNNDIRFGTGTDYKKIGESLVVSDVYKDSSAEKSGIKTGWIRKNCEVSPVSESGSDELVFREKFNCVFVDRDQKEREVTFFSNWYLQPRTITQVNSKLLNEQTLYLKFTKFEKKVDEWMKQQISQNPKVENIVFDLRGNTGGLLGELKDSLSLFFPPQTVIGTSIHRDLDEKTLRIGSADYYKGKVYVLIDSGSFSCAEIFASAFKESGRGTVIGQKSGGQVLFSRTNGLSNNLNVQIPIWDYRSIKGNRLEGEGVKPDIEVPLSVDEFARQKDKTYEEISKLLKLKS